MSRLEYWKNFIKTSDLDVLAKDLNFYWDPIKKKYSSYHEIEPNIIDVLKKETDISSLKVLDYGCGLGRNLDYLKSNFKSILGYDLQEMIEKGKVLDLSTPVTFDWDQVQSFSPDLVFDCTVFQHLDASLLVEKLIDISKTASYLYSHTRVYNDTTRDFANKTKGVNLFCLIYSLGVFKPIISTIDFNDAINKQDETHYSILYKIIK